MGFEDNLRYIIEAIVTLFVIILLGYVFYLVFAQLNPTIAILFVLLIVILVIAIVIGLIRRSLG